jgi:CDP-diacylglycerol--glycerol-3-phosphate 3-phosphatidyltransferase
MPTIYDLKPRFQGLLRPIVGGLARAGVTANGVTVFAAALSVGYGVFLIYGGRAALLGLPVLLFVRMALNAIDGMLAREHGQKSRLGAILNELGDVVSDTALYLPLAFLLGPGALLPVLLTVVLLSLGEMAGILGQVLGGGRRYDGPFGKSDRAAAYGTIGLLVGLGWISAIILQILLWLIVLLSAVTVFNRCRQILRSGETATEGTVAA